MRTDRDGEKDKDGINLIRDLLHSTINSSVGFASNRSMEFPFPTSRTSLTEAMYNKRARLILKRFEDEVGASWQAEPIRFVQWLADLQKKLRPNSWRQYRSALLFFLGPPVPENQDLIEAIRNIQAPPKKDLPEATSSRKTKRIPEASFQKVMEYLQLEQSAFDRHIANWLIAGRTTGLRPAEWKHAEILDENEDALILRCKNAKATNGRAHGEYRTLIVRHPAASERHAIQYMVSLGQSLTQEEFDRVLLAAGGRLNAINRLLFGPLRKTKSPKGNRQRGHGITLYSARHQFVADAKAAGLTKEEIAAIMGHRSIYTATEHYGKRRFGRAENFRVAPLKEDVLRVQALQKQPLEISHDKQ